MRSFDVRGILILAAVALLAGRPVTVYAQDSRDDGASQLLDVGLSVIGAYDSDAFLESLTPGFAQLQPSGYSTWGIGTLQYLRRFPRVQLAAAAGSAIRYYSEVRELRTVGHTGNVSLSANLPSRLTLQLNQVGAYSPSYLYGLFPALPASGADEVIVVAADYDYDVDPSSSYVSRTSMSLARSLSPRMSISAQGEFNHTDFSKESAVTRDLTTYSVGTRLSRNTTRNSILSVGYQYRTGEFGYAVGATTEEHAVNIGVDLSRPVSATRRVSFSFRVGGSLVGIPEAVAEFDVGGRQFKATGDLSVAYPFAREWQVRGSYTRGLQFVAGLTQPVFVDGFSGEINGRITNRVGILGRAGRATGQSLTRNRLLNAGDNLLDSYTGQVKITYLLTRRLTTYAEYFQYVYDSRGDVGTPEIPVAPGIPADLKRHGIHVGLSLQVPALRR